MDIIGVSLALDAASANRVLIPFACDISTTSGDLVYPDSVTDEKVISATDNTEIKQVIGIVYNKPQTNSCNVLVLGTFDGFSGLTKGDRIFLSTSGSLTTTKPTTGYMHNLGVAISATEVLFIPNNTRLLLNG